MRLREEHQKNQYLKQIVKQSVPEEVFLTKGMQVTIQKKNFRTFPPYPVLCPDEHGSDGH